MLATILTKWSLDPSVLGGLIWLSLVYWLWAHGRYSGGRQASPSRDWCFSLGVILALLALESPLDFLADRYLFSAHMFQHLMLILGVAPLLALAVPDALVADLKASRLAPALRRCGNPVAVFVVFVVDVWAWHAPALYEATLRSEMIHIAEHLSFIGLAAAFWWVSFAPNDGVEYMSMPARLGYVFLGGIPNTLLGAVITFAGTVLYPTYQLALDQPGLGRALQVEWGVNALTDQEFGGLLMWVPGGFAYLVVMLVIFMTSLARPRPGEPQTV